METRAIDIQGYFKVALQAVHIETNTTITFPAIHIVLEKASNDSFLATCIEFEQSYEDKTLKEASIGLIQYMYEYFFKVIQDEGRKFIYQQVKKSSNNELWDAVRVYVAKKYDTHLEFFEKSFQKDVNLKELSERIKANHLHETDLPSILPNIAKSRNAEDNEVIIKNQKELINSIKVAYHSLLEKYERLNKEHKELRKGLEIDRIWKQKDIEIFEPSVLN